MKPERPNGVARRPEWSSLAEFSARSGPSVARHLTYRTAAAVQVLGLPADYLETLKRAVFTAVASAARPTRGAQAVSRIVIRVFVSCPTGGPGHQSTAPPLTPEAPRARAEPTRPPPLQGWGFFLTRRMDALSDLEPSGAASSPAVELYLYC